MGKHQKFEQKLRSVPTPSDIRWTELRSYLEHLGYTMLNGGGSRRKFHHREKDDLILLHEPHPGSIVTRCYVADVAEHLESLGFFKD